MDEVKEALKGIGIDGMTITEVRGHGRQKGHKEVYRGQEYNVDLLPKVKVELVVASSRADEVVKTLTAAARSGKDRRRESVRLRSRRSHPHPQRRSRRSSSLICNLGQVETPAPPHPIRKSSFSSIPFVISPRNAILMSGGAIIVVATDMNTTTP